MDVSRHNYCKLKQKNCPVCKMSGGKTRCGYWKDRGLSEVFDLVDNIKSCPKKL